MEDGRWNKGTPAFSSPFPIPHSLFQTFPLRNSALIFKPRDRFARVAARDDSMVTAFSSRFSYTLRNPAVQPGNGCTAVN
jgi:hypothetical protein